jgi:hypothetical protein
MICMISVVPKTDVTGVTSSPRLQTAHVGAKEAQHSTIESGSIDLLKLPAGCLYTPQPPGTNGCTIAAVAVASMLIKPDFKCSMLKLCVEAIMLQEFTSSSAMMLQAAV